MKRVRRSVQVHKVKIKAELVKGDHPTERTVTVIPAGSLIQWAGSRRSTPRELNITWKGDIYAMRRDDWDAAEEIDEPDEAVDQATEEVQRRPSILYLSVKEVEGWIDSELSGEEIRARLKAKIQEAGGRL